MKFAKFGQGWPGAMAARPQPRPAGLTSGRSASPRPPGQRPSPTHLHKSYNFTIYSNITIERTLHKIIITHITFIFTKRSFFKQIDTQLQCRHLGCHTAVAATRARAPTRLAPRPLVPSWWPPVLPSLERSRHRRTWRRNRRSGQWPALPSPNWSSQQGSSTLLSTSTKFIHYPLGMGKWCVYG